jgi:TonB family protein
MSTTQTLAGNPKVAPIRFQPVLPQPPHPGRSLLAWSVPAVTLEVAVALVTVWMTASQPRVEPEPTETYHFVELTPDVSVPKPPPPPEPPRLPPAPTAVEPMDLKGFLTLTIPAVTLAEIPPPDLGRTTISARDFTGEGFEGGRGGTEMAPAPEPAGPTFTPFTVAPRLENEREVARALEREYPTPLRYAGIGGQVLLWLFIDASGKVEETVLKTSSGFELLDAAAMRVAILMEFTPAINRDRRVAVWVAIPVDFEVT